MDPTILALFIISSIIIIGLLAKVLFVKYKIPDVLILILFGAVLGFFKLSPSVSDGSGVMNVLIMFALIYIVFNGGLPISIKAIFSSARWAFISALLNLFMITLAITLLSLLFHFSLSIALTIGFLMCVMDGSIINAILENFKFSKRGEAFIQIESAIIDIFVIVAVVTIWVEKLSFGAISHQIVNFLVLSSALGFIFGLIWGIFIKKIGNIEHISLSTLAVLLLVYVSAEYFNANGVIAVFSFAITMGNLKLISKIMYKKDSEEIGALDRTQKIFFNDFAFMLRALLFVFLGTMIDFKKPWFLLLGFLFALVSITIRSFLFRLVNTEGVSEKERDMMQTMAAKGLTPVVMLSLIKGSSSFSNTIIGGIFFSVLLTSVFLFLIETNKFRNISCFLISLFSPAKEDLTENH